MYVKAKNEFNYGGILQMKCGECREIDDAIAKKLIAEGTVEENKPSYKKITIKKK